MKKEIFKDIPNYEGIYQVSDLGTVKRLPYKKWVAINNSYANFKERILSPDLSSEYPRVYLYNNGERKRCSVHQLIAITFLGHKPSEDGFVVNHINFHKGDSRLENLELITMRENSNLKHIPSVSKYVGVTLDKRTGRWVSRITYGKETKYIGRYDSEYDAHLAYQDELKHQRLKPIYNG